MAHTAARSFCLSSARPCAASARSTKRVHLARTWSLQDELQETLTEITAGRPLEIFRTHLRLVLLLPEPQLLLEPPQRR